MTQRLGVGVIGLGRRWRRRYRPLLPALRGRYDVRAVCDEVRRRAEREARHLRCDVAAGPAALLEREDVRAVLLVDPQWFGLWPVTLAHRHGKAVFCAYPPAADADTEALCRRVQESNLPVMAALTPRVAPALVRVREVLDAHLGPARLVRWDCVQPASGTPAGMHTWAAPLLDWSAALLGEQPVSVQAVGMEGGMLTSLFLAFPGLCGVHLSCRRAPHARSARRLDVVAEKGCVGVDRPGRVSWTDGAGEHVHRLPRRPRPGRVLLERFHDAVVSGRPVEPMLTEVCRVLPWLRAAERSLAEGRRVEVAAAAAEG